MKKNKTVTVTSVYTRYYKDQRAKGFLAIEQQLLYSFFIYTVLAVLAYCLFIFKTVFSNKMKFPASQKLFVHLVYGMDREIQRGKGL